jgi:hypothetical protein
VVTARKDGFEARLEQSPDGKLRERRRFHGHGKRGRQSRIDLDLLAIRLAIRELEAAHARIREVKFKKTLTPLERREAHRDALGRAALAERVLDEALDRPQPQ